MRENQRRADEVALIALNIMERSPVRMQALELKGGSQLLKVLPQEATLSLFLELGSMIVLTGSAGLGAFQERPADLSHVVEFCQGLVSRSNHPMRTANRRFAGSLDRSFAYLNGKWTEIHSSDDKPCVAIGLGGERLFAFRRDADFVMRELVVARPSFIGQTLVWSLLARVPAGTDAFLDVSRFVVNKDAARAIVRLRLNNGEEEHRLLTIKGDEVTFSEPMSAKRRVLRVCKEGIILHRGVGNGIQLDLLELAEFDIISYAYYHAAATR